MFPNPEALLRLAGAVLVKPTAANGRVGSASATGAGSAHWVQALAS
jgi:hypothetical protein